jgi:hypothetical protein
MEYNSAIKKEGNSVIYDNMGEPERYYIRKKKRPGTERLIPT